MCLRAGVRACAERSRCRGGGQDELRRIPSAFPRLSPDARRAQAARAGLVPVLSGGAGPEARVDAGGHADNGDLLLGGGRDAAELQPFRGAALRHRARPPRVRAAPAQPLRARGAGHAGGALLLPRVLRAAPRHGRALRPTRHLGAHSAGGAPRAAPAPRRLRSPGGRQDAAAPGLRATARRRRHAAARERRVAAGSGQQRHDAARRGAAAAARL